MITPTTTRNGDSNRVAEYRQRVQRSRLLVNDSSHRGVAVDMHPHRSAHLSVRGGRVALPRRRRVTAEAVPQPRYETNALSAPPPSGRSRRISPCPPCSAAASGGPREPQEPCRLRTTRRPEGQPERERRGNVLQGLTGRNEPLVATRLCLQSPLAVPAKVGVRASREIRLNLHRDGGFSDDERRTLILFQVSFHDRLVSSAPRQWQYPSILLLFRYQLAQFPIVRMMTMTQ